MSNIYVIGGANIDIIGTPKHKFILRDSNIGKLNYTFGGVGRNIAENMTLLGDKVKFVSVFGDDPYGHRMFEYCQSIGMDLSYSRIINNCNTSTYLALLDEKNDMIAAMSDMDILERLDIDFVKRLENVIMEDDYVVIDTNLRKDVIDYIASNFKCKKVVDPISTMKAEKIVDVISLFDVIKPNKLEAEKILNKELKDEKDLVWAAQEFVNKGVKEVLISLGSEGVLYGNPNDVKIVKTDSIEIVNATGAGDSFLGSYIHFRNKGEDINMAVRLAMSTAMITLSSEDTVCKTLNENSVIEYKNELKFEER